MKRALLIAGGTVGGLGAVLAITPPQLGSNSAINIAGAPVAGADTTASASASSSSAQSTTAAATAKATAAATKSPKPVATKKAGATATESAAPAATQAPAASSAKSINGSFTGPAVFVNYGTVQVKITVANGRITDAVAVQAPSGRNDRWTNMAVPILKQQTLAAQSANIQGASGASYTSYGWYTSLQGALAQAGL
jgi:uncharacterized protein with FMN-binding domain